MIGLALKWSKRRAKMSKFKISVQNKLWSSVCLFKCLAKNTNQNRRNGIVYKWGKPYNLKKISKHETINDACFVAMPPVECKVSTSERRACFIIGKTGAAATLELFKLQWHCVHITQHLNIGRGICWNRKTRVSFSRRKAASHRIRLRLTIRLMANSNLHTSSVGRIRVNFLGFDRLPAYLKLF